MSNKGSGPSDLFDSAWLKWGRAITHAEGLEDDIEGWAISDGERRLAAVEAKYKPHRHGFAIVVTDIDPMPERWGLVFGDVAFNFRACLDHVAWAMVHRDPAITLTEDQAKRVYYPVCGSRDWFNNVLKRGERLPGVSRADIAKVRRTQPYRIGKGRRPRHWLALLGAFNNLDKHRVVQPVGLQASRLHTTVTGERDCHGNRTARAGQYVIEDPMQVNAEIGFIRARKLGPHPELDVKCDITVKPIVEVGLSLADWIHATAAETATLLLLLSDPPKVLDDFGIRRINTWTPR